MTTEEFSCLETLLDDKLGEINREIHRRVEEQAVTIAKCDDDIKAFKAIFGAAVWLGGAILAIVVVLQGWYHK